MVFVHSAGILFLRIVDRETASVPADWRWDGKRKDNPSWGGETWNGPRETWNGARETWNGSRETWNENAYWDPSPPRRTRSNRTCI